MQYSRKHFPLPNISTALHDLIHHYMSLPCLLRVQDEIQFVKSNLLRKTLKLNKPNSLGIISDNSFSITLVMYDTYYKLLALLL